MELPSYSDCGVFIVNQNTVLSRVWIIGTCGEVLSYSCDVRWLTALCSIPKLEMNLFLLFSIKHSNLIFDANVLVMTTHFHTLN